MNKIASVFERLRSGVGKKLPFQGSITVSVNTVQYIIFVGDLLKPWEGTNSRVMGKSSLGHRL